MSYINKTVFLFTTIISTLFLISCNQSEDQQNADLIPTSNEISSTDISKSGSFVSLSKDELNVIDGEYFTVDVVMNDFIVNEGGAVTLRFNPKILQVSNVNVDQDYWEFVNSNGHVNNDEGVISDIVFSSYQGVSGNAVIATIEFRAISKGVSNIMLEESLTNPFSSNGEKISVSFVSTNVVSN